MIFVYPTIRSYCSLFNTSRLPPEHWQLTSYTTKEMCTLHQIKNTLEVHWLNSSSNGYSVDTRMANSTSHHRSIYITVNSTTGLNNVYTIIPAGWLIVESFAIAPTQFFNHRRQYDLSILKLSSKSNVIVGILFYFKVKQLYFVSNQVFSLKS